MSKRFIETGKHLFAFSADKLERLYLGRSGAPWERLDQASGKWRPKGSPRAPLKALSAEEAKRAIAKNRSRSPVSYSFRPLEPWEGRRHLQVRINKTGETFDMDISSPQVWRKGSIPSEEVGNRFALHEFLLRKVGNREVIPGYGGKWDRFAYQRWLERYRRKLSPELAAVGKQRAEEREKRIAEARGAAAKLFNEGFSKKEVVDVLHERRGYGRHFLNEIIRKPSK
jgi:hypothetical protein